MKRFLKTRFVLIICLTFGLVFALSSVVQAQEGCSPGYWKHVDKHLASWEAAGFDDSDQSFESVFGRVIEVRVKKKDQINGLPTEPDPTLIQALNAPGGGINALARQAVAALLNADSPDVEYSLSSGEVILIFQVAFKVGSKSAFEAAKNAFEGRNELVCPLNGDEV